MRGESTAARETRHSGCRRTLDRDGKLADSPPPLRGGKQINAGPRGVDEDRGVIHSPGRRWRGRRTRTRGRKDGRLGWTRGVSGRGRTPQSVYVRKYVMKVLHPWRSATRSTKTNILTGKASRNPSHPRPPAQIDVRASRKVVARGALLPRAFGRRPGSLQHRDPLLLKPH